MDCGLLCRQYRPSKSWCLAIICRLLVVLLCMVMFFPSLYSQEILFIDRVERHIQKNQHKLLKINSIIISLRKKIITAKAKQSSYAKLSKALLKLEKYEVKVEELLREIFLLRDFSSFTYNNPEPDPFNSVQGFYRQFDPFRTSTFTKLKLEKIEYYGIARRLKRAEKLFLKRISASMGHESANLDEDRFVNSFRNSLKKLAKLDKSFLNNRALMFPQFIPEPPPLPSSFYTFQSIQSNDTVSLENLHSVIIEALQYGGYYQKTYFNLVDGIAILTPIEQIDHKGEVIPNNRWTQSIAVPQIVTIGDYFRSLLFPNVGRYRTFLFWISRDPLTFSETEMGQYNFNALISEGTPDGIRLIQSKEKKLGYNCSILIYEFIKKENEKDGILTIDKVIDPIQHLTQSKILAILRANNWQ